MVTVTFPFEPMALSVQFRILDLTFNEYVGLEASFYPRVHSNAEVFLCFSDIKNF